jgi:hypothetical protein
MVAVLWEPLSVGIVVALLDQSSGDFFTVALVTASASSDVR